MAFLILYREGCTWFLFESSINYVGNPYRGSSTVYNRQATKPTCEKHI